MLHGRGHIHPHNDTSSRATRLSRAGKFSRALVTHDGARCAGRATRTQTFWLRAVWSELVRRGGGRAGEAPKNTAQQPLLRNTAALAISSSSRCVRSRIRRWLYSRCVTRSDSSASAARLCGRMRNQNQVGCVGSGAPQAKSGIWLPQPALVSSRFSTASRSIPVTVPRTRVISLAIASSWTSVAISP